MAMFRKVRTSGPVRAAYLTYDDEPYQLWRVIIHGRGRVLHFWYRSGVLASRIFYDAVGLRRPRPPINGERQEVRP